MPDIVEDGTKVLGYKVMDDGTLLKILFTAPSGEFEKFREMGFGVEGLRPSNFRRETFSLSLGVS